MKALRREADPGSAYFMSPLDARDRRAIGSGRAAPGPGKAIASISAAAAGIEAEKSSNASLSLVFLGEVEAGELGEESERTLAAILGLVEVPKEILVGLPVQIGEVGQRIVTSARLPLEEALEDQIHGAQGGTDPPDDPLGFLLG